MSIIYTNLSFAHSLTKFVFLVTTILLVACSTSRYSVEHDFAPKVDFDASNVPNAIPKWEPLSPSGNKSPYTVRGKRYSILASADQYVEEGIASWYGSKFHGELTSNGETYNMYQLTAAHKTLPLPSFLKVTNLENNKFIIVRVNDRGPFHGDRIIDLSYAAAKKLEYDQKGTANVRVEAIPLSAPNANDNDNEQSKGQLATFIQVAAFSNLDSANKSKAELASLELSGSVFVATSPNASPVVHRVRVGPYASETEAKIELRILLDAKVGSPMLISRAINGRSW